MPSHGTGRGVNYFTGRRYTFANKYDPAKGLSLFITAIATDVQTVELGIMRGEMGSISSITLDARYGSVADQKDVCLKYLTGLLNGTFPAYPDREAAPTNDPTIDVKNFNEDVFTLAKGLRLSRSRNGVWSIK